MNKLTVLKKIFGIENMIDLKDTHLLVNNKKYPIVDGVIILIEPQYYTAKVQSVLENDTDEEERVESNFSEKIQYSFGEEWKSYSDIKEEHAKEFELYFDLIDTELLKNSIVCDLGCGIGRWSYFLRDKCKELILVDFSDAIFEARKNLIDASNCIFFMGDIKKLPFKEDFADFIFSIGVLHHLPSNCLDEVRRLHKYAPEVLVYLYYSLDNRPIYFRMILALVTLLRKSLSKIRNIHLRKVICFLLTLIVYKPLIIIGKMANIIKLGRFVPLYEAYNEHSLGRLEQDVYDRFFTSIEQRVSKKEVLMLSDTYKEIIVSEEIPYWHFLCRR